MKVSRSLTTFDEGSNHQYPYRSPIPALIESLSNVSHGPKVKGKCVKPQISCEYTGLTVILADRYKSAARYESAAWDDDLDNFSTWALRYKRSSTVDDAARFTPSNSTENGVRDNIQPERRQRRQSLSKAPHKKPVSTFVFPSNPPFNHPTPNDQNVLLAELGFLATAPLRISRTRGRRPTKFSVVELCLSQGPGTGMSFLAHNADSLTAS